MALENATGPNATAGVEHPGFARDAAESTATPNVRTVQCVLDDRRLERIIELATLAESLWRSIAEAAWRGEGLTVQCHLAQARLVTIDALQLSKAHGKDADADQ